MSAPAIPTRPRLRATLRWLLIAVYLVAGTIHLRAPATFMPIMPGWVPHPEMVIHVTGIWEIAGALMMMTARCRQAAGWLLAAYAVIVYPANVKHAMDAVAMGGARLGWEYHAPRLLFQPVFVWWALFAGQVIDWPFRKTAIGIE